MKQAFFATITTVLALTNGCALEKHYGPKEVLIPLCFYEPGIELPEICSQTLTDINASQPLAARVMFFPTGSEFGKDLPTQHRVMTVEKMTGNDLYIIGCLDLKCRTSIFADGRDAFEVGSAGVHEVETINIRGNGTVVYLQTCLMPTNRFGWNLGRRTEGCTPAYSCVIPDTHKGGIKYDRDEQVVKLTCLAVGLDNAADHRIMSLPSNVAGIEGYYDWDTGNWILRNLSSEGRCLLIDHSTGQSVDYTFPGGNTSYVKIEDLAVTTTTKITFKVWKDELLPCQANEFFDLHRDDPHHSASFYPVTEGVVEYLEESVWELVKVDLPVVREVVNAKLTFLSSNATAETGLAVRNGKLIISNATAEYANLAFALMNTEVVESVTQVTTNGVITTVTESTTYYRFGAIVGEFKGVKPNDSKEFEVVDQTLEILLDPKRTIGLIYNSGDLFKGNSKDFAVFTIAGSPPRVSPVADPQLAAGVEIPEF